MDPDRLSGKNILITGAARGMGATNAEHFAEQGANVCLGDIDLDEAQIVADRINARGNGRAIGVPRGRTDELPGQRRSLPATASSIDRWTRTWAPVNSPKS
jgi:NAD(P)-dependent dehydrogenase (short-subunit alcohol dehydrogenase family)